MEFWTSFQCGITSASMHHYEEALSFTAHSSALRDTYRPALRYLIALAARDGRHQTAQLAATTLAEVEPDFSLDRLLNDPDYPVSLMRRSGLMDISALSRLKG